MTTSSEEQFPSSSAAKKTLTPSSIGALRLWMQTQRNGAMSGRPLHHSDVQRAMRLVCDEVRRRGLPVERLIILLKEQWYTLTDDSDAGNMLSRDALDEIIRTCIDEFYASAGNVSIPPSANSSSEAPLR